MLKECKTEESQNKFQQVMVVKWKRGRRRKSGEKVEAYFSAQNNRQVMARDRWKWRKIVSETKVRDGL